MRPKRERGRMGGVKCSDEEAKRERRVKREVGGEEKCSECLRAAQLEERMECGSSRAWLSHRCGYRQGVMARGSEGEVHRAANCIAPQS
jgi:hypothetical protein